MKEVKGMFTQRRVKKVWKFLLTFMLLVLTGQFGGCFSFIPRTAKIQIKYLKPPQLDIGKIRRIVISPFEGQGGMSVSNRLMAKLFEGRYYTILEREKVDALLKEMGLSERGIVDQTTAAQIGKALGAEGIIFGSVDGYTVTDDRSMKKVRKYRPEKEGGSYDIELPYILRRARLAVTFKMVNIETGELLGIKSITKEYSQGILEDPDNPQFLEPGDLILDKLIDQVTDEFLKQISPYYITADRYWEYIGVDEDRLRNYFTQNLFDILGDELDKLINRPGLKPEQLAAVYHNRGVVYEVLGNLNKAEEYHKQAVRLNPTDFHTNDLNEVRTRIEEVKKLQEMGFLK